MNVWHDGGPSSIVLDVDVGLTAGLAGAIAGIAGTGFAAWQVRLAIANRREQHQDLDSMRAGVVATGISLAVPLGRLPAEVRGREELLHRLGPSTE